MALLKDLIVQGASRFIGDAYFATIKAGVWNGTPIDLSHGGTAGTTTANQVLLSTSTSGTSTWGAQSSLSVGSATNATYAANVGTSGTVGTNYVTAATVIATCNWYSTMNAASDADALINRWVEVRDFLNNFTEADTLASILSTYVTLGTTQTITGAKTFSNPISGDLLGNATTADRLKSTTAVGSASLPVYFTGGLPVACTASSIFSSLSSNTTNAVSITICGQPRNITAATLKTSLGLGSNAYESYTLSGVSGRTINASTAGYCAYYSAASTVSGTSILTFDTTNSRVGIGTTSPSQKVHISGGILSITNNSNTISIGSTNSSFAHFTSGVQFYFGNAATFAGNTTPYTNNSYNLGSSSNRWKVIYGIGIDISGTATFSGSTTIDSLTAGNLTVTGASTLTGNVSMGTVTAGTWNGSVIDVAHGGTGCSTLTSGSALIGNGTGAVTFKAIDTTVTVNSSNLITSEAVATYVTTTLAVSPTISKASITKSLNSSTWTETGYTLYGESQGSYMLQITDTTTAAVFTGVFSVYHGSSATGNDLDEIPLHMCASATNKVRIYAATLNGKLLVSSQDTSATNHALTIKYKKII